MARLLLLLLLLLLFLDALSDAALKWASPASTYWRKTGGKWVGRWVGRWVGQMGSWIGR